MFTLNWTPYAVSVTLNLFPQIYKPSASMITYSALFAKFFLIWPSLLFLLTDRNLKKSLKKKFNFCTMNQY